MYTRRVYKPASILRFTYRKIIMLAIWSTIITLLYNELDFTWLKIPWVPLTLIGIAVAFYMGFKNNSAYERAWEARKVWGAIVNSSRSWGIMVTGFITDEFAKSNVETTEIQQIHKRMIYRHIAWLYRLKRQLRVIKSWEHNRNENNFYRKY